MADSLNVAISGVRTDTHLIHVASSLRHLLGSGNREVFVTDLDSGRNVRRPSPAMMRELLLSCLQVNFLDALRPSQPVHHYIAVGAPGIKPWLQLRRRQMETSFSTIVVDDGIGSYGSQKSRRRAIRREGASAARAVARAFAVDAARRTLLSTRWSMYERASTQWSVRPEIADEFGRHLKSAPPPMEPAVVYLSQPWPELGVVTEVDYVRHLDRVRAAVEEASLDFRLRPHPGESLGRYGSFDVLAPDGPAEIDPRVVSAVAILGETSTALLNTAALFGVPAVRVVAPYERSLRADVSDVQRSLLDYFLSKPVAVDRVAQLLPSVGDAAT